MRFEQALQAMREGGDCNKIQANNIACNKISLTEKWKKGELPSGWYWVELKEGTFVDGKKSVILDYLFEFTNDFERHPYLVESVLAPVPSYEEYQKLLSDQLAKNEGIEINAELEAENTKLKTENKWYSEQFNEAAKEVGHLKELLTMVKPVLQLEYNVTENRNLIKKINQVLGE